MTPVQLYCKIRGHRFVAYHIRPGMFMGVSSNAGRCVRCHENLWFIKEEE